MIDLSPFLSKFIVLLDPASGCGVTGRVIPHYDAVSRNTVCHSRLDLESRKYSGVNTSQFFLTFWTLHRRAG